MGLVGIVPFFDTYTSNMCPIGAGPPTKKDKSQCLKSDVTLRRRDWLMRQVTCNPGFSLAVVAFRAVFTTV